MLYLVEIERNSLHGTTVELLKRAFELHLDVLGCDGLSLVLSFESIAHQAASKIRAVEVVLIGPGVNCIKDLVENSLRCLSQEVSAANAVAVLDNSFFKPVLAEFVIDSSEFNMGEHVKSLTDVAELHGVYCQVVGVAGRVGG